MKVIDLLNKIANNEEVPKKFKYRRENFVYMDGDYSSFDTNVWFSECHLFLDNLNDEIEIIEQETTYEQNFTGWQLIQNGKVVASYNAQRLKPADVVDVKKDVKEMLEEKPKKIEELELVSLEEFKTMTPAERYHVTAIEYDRINDLTKAVNYLLEKESDK